MIIIMILYFQIQIGLFKVGSILFYAARSHVIKQSRYEQPNDLFTNQRTCQTGMF